MKAAVTLLATLALLAPLASANSTATPQDATRVEVTRRHCPKIRAAIETERRAVWRLQHELRRPATKVSRQPAVGCAYRGWILKLWRGRHDRLRLLAIMPRGETQLRAYINDDCLEEIVDRETGGTWDPTIDYGFGHGDVTDAYGLPQAKPGYKMRSAGADYATNPRTQIRWMRSYVDARYGGSCNALAHHNSQGWY